MFVKILDEICEKSLGLGDGEKLGGMYKLRKSARAILLNEKGEIATQYLKTYNYHKLPGGGMESGETIETALKREVLEEVGYECEIIRPIGAVIEYCNTYSLFQISYAFVAKICGGTGVPVLENSEIEEGQITLWLPPLEVYKRMTDDVPGKFEGHFIRKREMKFIKEYLQSL